MSKAGKNSQLGAVFLLEPGLSVPRSQSDEGQYWELDMGRGLLLWLIGIPLPIILVVWLLGGLN
ncbi:hypothetical protein [Pseudorhodoplanes sinuspersici]|uniref:Uncharacterized protein n=1 Tax=Pseudorhodoplanes sinuspersici TaxID=1235591 RepID=A0A1W6ZMN0_9HYPH|nr:hypothetical protein [Pseudorhodoplanes sinuspersici]ARP98572.1 hypothetical protein CAK95_05355 [Pseudorhodoplanes sinuspersici]